MELKELVSRQVQSFESIHATKGLKHDGWATNVRHRGEEVAGKVQILQVLEVEHVVW